MIEFDHVLIAVRDLDAAAVAFEERYGLASVSGGRHTGLGTGNRIIPLGPSYLELIAVVDEAEAASSPLAQWVTRLSADGDGLAGLCLRTDDIDTVAERLGTFALPMERARPDGGVLKWRLAGLPETLADPALPFFIQWDVSLEDMPGNAAVSHRIRPTDIEWVEIACDEDSLRRRVGTDDLDVRVVDGEPGLRAVGIGTTEGTLVIRD